jgi:signal peptidase I
MDQITTTGAPESTVPQPPLAPQPKGRHWLVALFFDLGSTLIPAIVIALLIHVFLAQATRVYGQSMEPNLHTDQRLVIEKLSYHFHGPRRGDVVVIHDPSGSPELLIKRVIGLPGERITVTDGRVYVDGTALDEPYLTQPTTGGGRSWIVPPLNVFVMGDNRSASRDSRIFGPVPLDQIVGHAVLRYWPPEQIGILH